MRRPDKGNADAHRETRTVPLFEQIRANSSERARTRRYSRQRIPVLSLATSNDNRIDQGTSR